MLEHGEQVLAEAERAPEEIGAVAAPLDRLDAAQERAVWAGGRAPAPGRVEAQELAARWASDDLEPVGATEREAAK